MQILGWSQCYVVCLNVRADLDQSNEEAMSSEYRFLTLGFYFAPYNEHNRMISLLE